MVTAAAAPQMAAGNASSHGRQAAGAAEQSAADAARHAVQVALRAEKNLNIHYDNVMEMGASDFGGMWRQRPSAVVHPTTVHDIARVVQAVSCIPGIGVAARGNGHSINGQAQALHGVVINMRSLKDSITIGKEVDGSLYADVGAGKLWIEVLDATLCHSLTPRTWTDYLYLSVGGTLQNAGIGGQTFKHGPQISNVTKLDVMTASGELRSCSPTLNSDLFYATLGGLGQFGIVTKARIILEPAPQKVRWIRVVYWNFQDFTHDQEWLISRRSAGGFDYVEGFVVTNSNDPAAGWPQIPLPEGAAFNHRLLPPSAAAAPMLYCLELAKYFNASDAPSLDQQIDVLMRPLRCVEGLRFDVELRYREFLNRVHAGEPRLRETGLWDAPHPWLCLLVPRSHIHAFDAAIFKQSKTLRKGVGGPMLVYPMLSSK